MAGGLMGDAGGAGELANELSRADPVRLENDREGEEELSHPEDWVPDPVYASREKSTSKHRSSDISSSLLVGNKDLFISEYRTLLADRLLHQCNDNDKKEIQTVKMLKRHFGEAQMHDCEVMLKDMVDSRRINANICNDEQKLLEQEKPSFSLETTILSSEFWPLLKEEKLELPGPNKEAKEAHSKKYKKLKDILLFHTSGPPGASSPSAE